MAQERVVLVDAEDNPVGTMEKIEAHERGLLHRAFSVFVLRQVGERTELLLQKRATTKYHFGGLWTNTCCGHPREGENAVEAGRRRLPEEMSFDCELEDVGNFVYQATSPNGLIEHELDHVLVGHFQGEAPPPNPAEADGSRWVALADLDAELEAAPDRFTPWFAPAYATLKRRLAL